MMVLQQVVLAEITCGGCAIVYAVPADWLADKRLTGKGFTCPNGCTRCYAKPTPEVEKLRSELAAEKSRRDRAEALAATARAEVEAQATMREKAEKALGRIKKRVHGGVCPHCPRTVQNLRRHIATKHPKEAEGVHELVRPAAAGAPIAAG